MGRIEIEVDGEGRYKRLIDREHILAKYPAPVVFGCLLDAAHSVLGPPRPESKVLESGELTPGTYEIRFFGNCIDATRLDNEPLIREPYHLTIGGSYTRKYRIRGTSLTDLTIVELP